MDEVADYPSLLSYIIQAFAFAIVQMVRLCTTCFFDSVSTFVPHTRTLMHTHARTHSLSLSHTHTHTYSHTHFPL